MLPLRLAELDLAERGRERERESERGHCFEENLANDRPIERPSLPTFILHRLARGALAPISTLNSSLLPPPVSPSPPAGSGLRPLRAASPYCTLWSRYAGTRTISSYRNARTIRAISLRAPYERAVSPHVLPSRSYIGRSTARCFYERAQRSNYRRCPEVGGATRQRLSESLDETFGRTRTFRASRRDDGTSRLA